MRLQLEHARKKAACSPGIEAFTRAALGVRLEAREAGFALEFVCAAAAGGAARAVNPGAPPSGYERVAGLDPARLDPAAGCR